MYYIKGLTRVAVVRLNFHTAKASPFFRKKSRLCYSV